MKYYGNQKYYDKHENDCHHHHHHRHHHCKDPHLEQNAGWSNTSARRAQYKDR